MELQLALFDRSATPRCDPAFARLQRHCLGEAAWADHVSGWVQGHQGLFDALASQTRWQQGPSSLANPATCLSASVPVDGPGHPLLSELSHALTLRYGRCLTGVELRLYRHGRDHSPATPHRAGRGASLAGLTAVLGLGAPRTIRVRSSPKQRPKSFHLGWGDLLVVGGSARASQSLETPRLSKGHGAQLAVHFHEDTAAAAAALAAR